jgi:hypothetical protein
MTAPPPPPPANFHPAHGIQHAEFTNAPALRQRRYTGRRLQGIRYERKVHEYLEFRYGELYVASPWLRFLSDGKWRWCQPDGLLFQPETGRIIVVECKYQHTADAWWQTRHLYIPVLQRIFPAHLWSFEVCEVVKWFDPSVAFPERLVLANEVGMRSEAFKVHIYKP